MEYQLGDYKTLGRFENNSFKGQLANNAVIDIKTSGDSLYFFGTGNGLSYADILSDGTIDFGYFSISAIISAILIISKKIYIFYLRHKNYHTHEMKKKDK